MLVDAVSDKATLSLSPCKFFAETQIENASSASRKAGRMPLIQLGTIALSAGYISKRSKTSLTRHVEFVLRCAEVDSKLAEQCGCSCVASCGHLLIGRLLNWEELWPSLLACMNPINIWLHRQRTPCQELPSGKHFMATSERCR